MSSFDHNELYNCVFLFIHFEALTPALSLAGYCTDILLNIISYTEKLVLLNSLLVYLITQQSFIICQTITKQPLKVPTLESTKVCFSDSNQLM